MSKDLQQNSEHVSNELFEQFEGVINGLSVVKTQINTLQQTLKQLEKNVKKQMKGLKKEVVKNKIKGNRKPSGFAKPSKVTKELCEFMKRSEGTEIARTEVTKALIEYIRKKNLQNQTNHRIIVPDEKLKILLGIEQGEVLTYFNLQKYLSKHFIKKYY